MFKGLHNNLANIFGEIKRAVIYLSVVIFFPTHNPKATHGVARDCDFNVVHFSLRDGSSVCNFPVVHSCFVRTYVDSGHKDCALIHLFCRYVGK